MVQRGVAVAVLAVVLLAMPAIAGAACSGSVTATSWTGGGAADTWSDASNWSGGVPGPCSDVTIARPDSNALDISGVPTGTPGNIHALTVDPGVRLHGGSLMVETTLDWETAPNGFSNGIGFGLTVGGHATWHGGGQTFFETGGTSTTVSLTGGATFSGGTNYIETGSSGMLSMDGTVTVEGDALEVEGDGGATSLVFLPDTLSLTTGDLAEPGHVLLEHLGGSVLGNVSLGQGAELAYDSVPSILANDGTTLSGPGLVSFTGATTAFDLPAPLNLANGAALRLNQGVMSDGSIAGTGALQWKGGHLAGDVALGSGVTTTLSTSGEKHLDADAAVSNAGTFDLAGDTLAAASGSPTFSNTGTLKGGGTIQAPFTQTSSGVLDVHVGSGGATRYDVGGAAAFGGTLQVHTDAGFMPSGSYTIATHTSRSGDFTTRTGVTPGYTLGSTATQTTLTATGTDPNSADNGVRVVSVAAPEAVNEGGVLRFPVRLDSASNRTVSARLSTQDGTATAASGDYTARSNVTVTFPAGQTEAFFEVQTKSDFSTEGDETVKATISGGTNVTAGTLTATGTIHDVPPPKLSVSPADAVDEGGVLRFPVRLDRASNTTVTARLSTQDGTATAASGDYTALSNVTVTFQPGQTEAFFEVETKSDFSTEGDETVKATISGGTNATAGTPMTSTGTIHDVPPPKLSVAPADAVEGGVLRFPVRLDRASDRTVSARLSTQDGTARAASGDYTALSNVTVTFQPGQTEAFFEVQTSSDAFAEGDETVKATISGGMNATAGTPMTSTGTIHDAAARVTPLLGELFGARLVGPGHVFARFPAMTDFAELSRTAGIPVGSELDVRNGRIELVSATTAAGAGARAAARRIQRATFSGGMFKVSQKRGSALVTLTPTGRELKRCRGRHGKGSRVLQGDGSGRHRITARSVTITVSGRARWTLTERCGATTVEVLRGRASVLDRAHRRTIVARAGRTVRVRGT